MSSIETRMTDASEVRAEWDELARRVQASPFMHPGWLLAWQEAFGTTPLRVVAAFEDGRLRGVLPVHVKRGFMASPTNWHTPDFSVVAETPETYEALVGAALGAGRPWQLELSFVDHETRDRVTTVAQRLGHRTTWRVLERSPHIPLAHSSFDEYVAALPKHTRSEIRRRRRKLETLGQVSVEVHQNADEAAFAAFLEVENSGWKAQQGTSVAQDAQAAAFYPMVARWAAEEGWLRLALLRVGDQVIAGDLSVQAEGVHYLLKTGFDEKFRSFGPGKILRLDMIERAFADGLTSYEFLGDEDEWKKEWTSQVQQRLRVQVFGHGPAGQLVRAGQLYARPAAKRLIARVRKWRSHP